ncbi:MAG: UbiX family flavin prenyltransferase [Candidatus Micrarchaeia archaeon]
MKFLVAVSGASGIAYAKPLVDALKKHGHEVKVVVSEGAKLVAKHEKAALPKSDYSEADLSAPFASGSYKFDGMVVIPCSVKTLGEIANGVGSTLITRAAEVCLKERRKLVLVVRETPLSLIAIDNMRKVALAGAVVMPASPGFYSRHQRVEDLINFIVGKVMDQLGVEHSIYKRWG